jgi:energy-coupling factor transporter ATP-binding protein EcfA2
MFDQVLPGFIAKRLNDWIKNSSSVSVFVTGKTGTGKSTLVNGILGTVICKEGHTLKPETTQVKSFQLTENGIKVSVWDSPGLQDGTTEESKYLDNIRRNCKGNIDLFLYCIDMSATRFVSGNPDIKAMWQLTNTLGQNMWKNALIVLTFANVYILQVEDDFDNPEELRKNFLDEVESWRDVIHQAMQEEVGLDPELVKNVAVVPAGDYNTPEIVPGDGLWLSKLWKESISATRPLAQPAFVKLNTHRLVDASQPAAAGLVHEQPLVLADIGQILGRELGVGYQIAIGFAKAQEMKLLYYLAECNGYTSEDGAISVDIDSYKKQ